MVDWLIVGGGIHGTTLALALIDRVDVQIRNIRIVDPNPEPLFAWRANTSACGMRFLRSPGSHSLDSDFTALRRWAVENGYGAAHFAAPYFRPSAEVFDAHSRFVIRRSGIETSYLQDLVTDIEATERGFVAHCGSGGSLTARNIVLAVGRGAPANSEWTQKHEQLRHVFGVPRTPVRDWVSGRVVVIGGGNSAVQSALSAVDSGRAQSVTLLSPSELSVHLFDSEPCYIGPRCLPDLLSEPSMQRRSELLKSVRHPGSVPPYLAEEYYEVERTGRIQTRIGYCNDIDVNGMAGGRMCPLEVNLVGGETIAADSVVLATGFAPQAPGDSLVGRIAQRFAAPVDDRGIPVPDISCTWVQLENGAKVIVSGLLGELVLGPAAGNIIGAHMAARRIVGGLRGRVTPQSIPWTWAQSTG